MYLAMDLIVPTLLLVDCFQFFHFTTTQIVTGTQEVLNSCLLLHRIRITFYLVSILSLIHPASLPPFLERLNVNWLPKTGVVTWTIFWGGNFSFSFLLSPLYSEIFPISMFRHPESWLLLFIVCRHTSCWPLAFLASLDVLWGHTAISHSSEAASLSDEVLRNFQGQGGASSSHHRYF